MLSSYIHISFSYGKKKIEILKQQTKRFFFFPSSPKNIHTNFIFFPLHTKNIGGPFHIRKFKDKFAYLPFQERK